ncbi:MAG: GtrA family protein [Lachnospiraceae bacterium]|nr:GtrA family protein [Lachnospiraceae bacterium]
MIAKLRAYLTGEALRYLIFGILTTAVSIGSYHVFRRFNLPYQPATVLSWILAVTFAFITNKLFVFQSRKKGALAVLREAFSFFSCRLMSLAFEIVFMFVTVDRLYIDDFLAKCMTQAFIFLLNYLFSKFLIFRKTKE